jgi:hypothetical protein
MGWMGWMGWIIGEDLISREIERMIEGDGMTINSLKKSSIRILSHPSYQSIPRKRKTSRV